MFQEFCALIEQAILRVGARVLSAAEKQVQRGIDLAEDGYQQDGWRRQLLIQATLLEQEYPALAQELRRHASLPSQAEAHQAQMLLGGPVPAPASLAALAAPVPAPAAIPVVNPVASPVTVLANAADPAAAQGPAPAGKPKAQPQGKAKAKGSRASRKQK